MNLFDEIRNKLEVLNSEDFRVLLLTRIKRPDDSPAFISMNISLAPNQDLINKISLQIIIGVIWSVMIHGLFIIYVFYTFFGHIPVLRRLNRFQG